MSEQEQSEEIAELLECIEIVLFNLSNGIYDVAYQIGLLFDHRARIAELEKK